MTLQNFENFFRWPLIYLLLNLTDPSLPPFEVMILLKYNNFVHALYSVILLFSLDDKNIAFYIFGKFVYIILYITEN